MKRCIDDLANEQDVNVYEEKELSQLFLVLTEMIKSVVKSMQG